ncbi:Hypothetical protein CINCED_3A010057, partial [Cinara cedri]
TYFVTRDMLLEMLSKINSISTIEPDVSDDEDGTSYITEYSEEVNEGLIQPAIESSADSGSPESGSGSIITSDCHDITANNAPLTFGEADGAFPQRYFATLNHSSVRFPLTGNLFSPITKKCIALKQGPLSEISLDKINSISECRPRERCSAGALLSNKSAVTGLILGLSFVGFVKIVPALLRKWFI